MDLSVNRREIEGVSIVEVLGEVDVSSAPILHDGLSELLDSGVRSIVVDLSGVGFLDSTGLGTLVGLRKRADELGTTLAVACSQERVLKLFRITGLDSVFAIYPSGDVAISALGSAA